MCRPHRNTGLVAVVVTTLLTAPAALWGDDGSPSCPLGCVRFAVSCKAAVAAELDRAVALLHHMTYQQARDGFEAVAVEDPSCAMAHWGIAMTLFQPLWPNRPGPEELRRGAEEVARAAALQPPTERERLFVAAAGEFFRDSEVVDHWERLRRWERAQEALYRAYPQDLEAAAFFALAHLATAPRAERPLDQHERAAEILLELQRRQPTHPGAVHYLIHANDIAGREHRSLDVVRSYAEIAPENPHALHMPTHIFVRLGSWQEVIDWNRRAARAALAHPAGDRGEYVSDELPHALEYLAYAALQQGDEATAREAWEQLRDREDLEPTFKTAFHLASIPARLALERRAWSEAAALQPRRPAWVDWDRFPWPEAVTWFARGLGSARLGELAAAREAAASLERLRQRAEERGEEPFAREIEILRRELAGWIALGDGDAEAAIGRLRSAVELQDATPKQPVTPAPILPAQELLGDLLLEIGRPAEALDAYRRSLAAAPGRRGSLRGVERATAALARGPAPAEWDRRDSEASAAVLERHVGAGPLCYK